MVSILRLTELHDVDKTKKRISEETSGRCKPFQKLSMSRFRFSITILKEEKLSFGYKTSTVMTVHQAKQILNVLGEAKGLSTIASLDWY